MATFEGFIEPSFNKGRFVDGIRRAPLTVKGSEKAPKNQNIKKNQSRLFAPIWIGFEIIVLMIIIWPYSPRIKLPVQQFAVHHTIIASVLPPTFRPPDPAPPLRGDWLVIPAINVKEEIWEGKSLDILWTHEGVWHQSGDKEHNYVLAGHRFQYLPPNTDTFYNLGKLKAGDELQLVHEGNARTYTVVRTFMVTPEHIEILNPTSTPELTLYTCTDWQSTQRLVVVAKLKK